jgi:choline-glycine betaine transporter
MCCQYLKKDLLGLVTAVFTLSAYSGVGKGIKFLFQANTYICITILNYFLQVKYEYSAYDY